MGSRTSRVALDQRRLGARESSRTSARSHTLSLSVVALASGACLPLAFAPYGWFPIALVSIAGLFFAWRDASAREALLFGWLFGLGSFGTGVSWLHHSFQFVNLSFAFATLCTVVFVFFLALYPAAVGYACKRIAPRARRWVLLTVLFPGAWVLGEWLRGWLFTGFTWLQLGYSQIDTPLAGFMPVLGTYAVSFLVGLSAGVVVLCLSQPRYLVRGLGLLVAVWGGGFALRYVEWTEAAGAPIEVALIQGNVPQAEKWLPEKRQPTLDQYLSMTREHWNADLVVWPETALPGYYHELIDFVGELGREASANDTDLILGVPVADPNTRRFYNALVMVGNAQGVYYKHHLVPFGEYLPLDAVLRPITKALGIPVSNFSRGPADQPLLEGAGHAIGATICYEVAFGSEVIKALPKARILLTVSNDAWFGDSVAPHQHLEIARARAVETGRYLVRATNTGISALVDPLGRVLARSPQFESHVLAGRVTPFQGRTPYVSLGDLPVLLVLMLLVASASLSRRRRRARGE